MIAIAPSKLATLHVFQPAFGRWKLSARADHKLPQVLLAQAEMKSEPEKEERSDGLGRRAWVAALIGHALDDFLGDFSVFSKRAFGLEHAHDRLERIPMDAGHALDFFLPLRRMLEGGFACSMPVILGGTDFGCGDQSGYRFQIYGELTMLPHPARFRSNHAEEDLKHVFLPFRIKAAAPLSPLQIPIPDTRKDQETERQLGQRHPIALYSSFR